MNGTVNENEDGSVEWQALEMKSFLRACTTCLPTSSDGQREAEGQLTALLREVPCNSFFKLGDGMGPKPVML